MPGRGVAPARDDARRAARADTPHNETIALDRLRDYFTYRLSATEDNAPTAVGTTDAALDEYEATAMPKQTPKQIHVTKNPVGWGATHAGASRSSIPRQSTQADAERVAKDLAKRTGGAEVVTHRPDGKIRSSDTIARPDPHPPIDKEH
jgi:hypothetical protein